MLFHCISFKLNYTISCLLYRYGVNKIMQIGQTVKHHLYGIGVIQKKTNSFLHVKFNNIPEEKRMLEDYLEIYNQYKEKILKCIKDLSFYPYINKKLLENALNRNELNHSIESIKYIKQYISSHNNKYFQNEIFENQEIFNIEGYELDYEQKKAVVSDEISQLVIAGAGCGKTSMLISKIAYLIKKGVNPEKILVLSLTNKTVNDLNDRLKRFNVEAKTFHSAGCYYANKNNHNTSRAQGNEELYEVVENITGKFTNSDIKGFPLIIRNVLEYIGFYYNYDEEIEKYLEKYSNKISIEKYENGPVHKTIRQVIENLEQENRSAKGEYVKSPREAQIANFLFLNGIDYEYERKYTRPYIKKDTEDRKKKTYYPDFYIKNKDKGIWLEHFSVTIDNDGSEHAAWCKDEKRYLSEKQDKIATHTQNHTILIQTNETMFKQGTAFDELKKQLEEHGVVLQPISDDKLEKYIKKIEKWEKYKSFLDFTQRVICLFKSQSKHKTLDGLRDKLLQDFPDKKQQTSSFFNIANKIYKRYQNELEKNNQIDFADMISLANEELKKLDIDKRYDYIIVDEFQDINTNQGDFLKFLQQKNHAKLFCVGDDWQSIYGFAGSDISLFGSFDYPYADTSLRLNQTFRNSQELLDICGKFILKNPKQIKKSLISSKQNNTPIKMAHYYHGMNNSKNSSACQYPYEALKCVLDDIVRNISDNERTKTEVALLFRYKNDITSILYNKDKNNQFDSIWKNLCDEYPMLDLSYTTIHQAKGLQYDNTILFLQEGENIQSFPSGYTDNYLLEPLLYKTDNFPNAEERRIFYVGLTRNKNQCYIVNSLDNPSSFFNEIKEYVTNINPTLEEYCSNTNQELCPFCKNGIYGERENKKGQIFWACDNMNCTHTSSVKEFGICPACQVGVLVERSNTKDNTKFLGCSNFPECKYTCKK